MAVSQDTVDESRYPSIIHESSLWRQQPVPVSAVLITYNQCLFVREALASLLAQSYPLDIVISDDFSSDRTLSVIQAMLAGYGGPHRVSLLQGLVNVGICRNQNKAIALAQGELIVLFEGDDISSPERVSKLVQMYLSTERKTGALGSGIRLMDGAGGITAEISWPTSEADAWSMVRAEWTVHGCGLAFRRDCFFEIGPISRHLISGDIALWMRAAFVRNGGMMLVPRALVDYRVHGQNTSQRFKLEFTSPEALRKCCRRLLKNEVAQMLELKKIMNYRRRTSISDERTERALNVLRHVARLRARLVSAISKHSAMLWFWPALLSLRYSTLRPLALRAIILALLPNANRVYRRMRPGFL